ncbi:hypothetical protein ACU610_11370 [Geodermatophilus sp. URMC 61]|uniref:hypothetical protein n=1 Tax=Geodermatophilus sp. URMC 61 TaxID=3423411 RepID=UPI00406D215D
MELHEVLEAQPVLAVPSVGDWTARGALAVGLGTALCSREDIHRRDRRPVGARARAALDPGVPV